MSNTRPLQSLEAHGWNRSAMPLPVSGFLGRKPLLEYFACFAGKKTPASVIPSPSICAPPFALPPEFVPIRVIRVFRPRPLPLCALPSALHTLPHSPKHHLARDIVPKWHDSCQTVMSQNGTILQNPSKTDMFMLAQHVLIGNSHGSQTHA